METLAIGYPPEEFQILESRGRDREKIKKMSKDEFQKKYWDARVFGNTFWKRNQKRITSFELASCTLERECQLLQCVSGVIHGLIKQAWKKERIVAWLLKRVAMWNMVSTACRFL
jgi:hypothetical protein